MSRINKSSCRQFVTGAAVKPPSRATKYSAGYDFYSPIEFQLAPGESIVVETYVAAYMQEDEYLAIYPRSGQGFKFYARLANTVGVIDKDFFPKTIKVKIRNESSDQTLTIEKDQAFCQGIFSKYLLTDDDSFEGQERNGGFGSTDTRLGDFAE